MKIIKAFPPNFAELSLAFPIKGVPGILYAWGDTIYNPSGIKVPHQLVAHEEVHGKRQQDHWHSANVGAVDIWWGRYILDPAFRLAEEILAHRAEWRAYEGPDAEMYLERMAERLSSPLYGYLISRFDAREEILNAPNS